MSEFKEGDWLTSKSHAGLLIFYKYVGEKAFVDVISRSGKSIGLSAYKLSELEHASEAEIKAGHRIDTKQIEDIGDDEHLENHISPNCKAKDV